MFFTTIWYEVNNSNLVYSITNLLANRRFVSNCDITTWSLVVHFYNLGFRFMCKINLWIPSWKVFIIDIVRIQSKFLDLNIISTWFPLELVLSLFHVQVQSACETADYYMKDDILLGCSRQRISLTALTWG